MRIKLGYPRRIRQIATTVRGHLYLDENSTCQEAVTHLTTNSNELEAGDMFVALKGEKNDGHSFISEAIARGASCVLCEKQGLPEDGGCCFICVDSTWEALSCLAVAHAKEIPHKTVAVTGSVGKTTTRRFLSRILSQRYTVWESEGNYNNLLGTCLTLLSMPREAEVLVAECGMDERGQIARLSAMLSPDVAVITNIGICHLERLGSQEEIAKAKLEILSGMPSPCLFCPREDEYLTRLVPNANFVSTTSTSGVWRAENADCDGRSITFDAVTTKGRYARLCIPTIGMHTLSCAMLALAVSDAMGLEENEIRAGLKDYTPVGMRQATKMLDRITLFIDCYNACPASMQAAFHSATLLAKASGGRTHALLGDMLELGEESHKLHRQTGEALAKAGFSTLFCEGYFAPDYQAGAISGGMFPSSIHLLPQSPELAGTEIATALSPRDVLLIKGSRGAHMEALIPYIEKALND